MHTVLRVWSLSQYDDQAVLPERLKGEMREQDVLLSGDEATSVVARPGLPALAYFL